MRKRTAPFCIGEKAFDASYVYLHCVVEETGACDRKIGEQLVGELSSAWHADVGNLLSPEITAPGYDLRPRLKAFDRAVLVLYGRHE